MQKRVAVTIIPAVTIFPVENGENILDNNRKLALGLA